MRADRTAWMQEMDEKEPERLWKQMHRDQEDREESPDQDIELNFETDYRIFVALMST
jgi:hypothetical protein